MEAPLALTLYFLLLILLRYVVLKLVPIPQSAARAICHKHPLANFPAAPTSIPLRVFFFSSFLDPTSWHRPPQATHRHFNYICAEWILGAIFVFL